jgi:hypothetical protein
MLSPSTDINAVEDLVTSYNKARHHIKFHDFEKSLYPKAVMRQADKEGTIPKCIFLPSRKMIRTMFEHVIT